MTSMEQPKFGRLLYITILDGKFESVLFKTLVFEARVLDLAVL
jgi:hypothetical protein